MSAQHDDRPERDGSALQQLTRLQNHIRLFSERSPFVLWEVGEDLSLQHASQKVEDLVGVTPAKLEAYGLDALFERVHPADRDRLTQALLGMMEWGEPYDVEFRVDPGDGEWRWLHDSGVRVRDQDGRWRGYCVAVDITDRKQAEQQMQRSQKVMALGTLAAGLAHEIRSPLQALVSSGSMLRQSLAALERLIGEGGEQFRDLERALEINAAATERIRHVVTELGNFSRPEGAKARAAEPVDLSKVADAAIELLSVSGYSDRSRLFINLAPDLPQVIGHQRSLEQVVVNLIKNAVEASNELDEWVVVSTRYDAELEMVEIVIEDSGVGMSPKELERVREPFFTTKRDQGGTGLGLAISVRIIEEHGGSLDFDSAVGRGTSVRVSLPKGS